MVKEKVKIKIKELVDRYKNLEQTRSEKEMSEISEANVRADFIDPLFEALGWHTKDPDEYDREHYVRKVGHADVALKLKKEPVVFVEAKRFGAIEDIGKRGEADWLDAERQVMNYALGKGIKWAILTNFEKFRLFNAFNGFTVLDIKAYWEYEERLDDLIYLTRDSLEIGHIDKLERREERPDVDYQFLESLNRWRLKLANDIYYNNYANEEQYTKEWEDEIKSAEKLTDQRLKKFKIEVANKKLSEVDYSILKDEKGDLRINILKSAVQRVLDRLVIIRYAEDRLIMDNPDQLRALSESWQSTKKYTSLFGSLKNFFAGFNEIHDSSIFVTGHICEKVKVSDELIGEIIKEMYEINFRKFDFDILGNTYESYLGHTLNITEDGKVELVPSQETRKESGIYYTPPYVVDYIVKNTIGEVLKEKKPEEVKNIRVLDPACGSGSFLIKAYDYFEDYYKKENEKMREEKRRKIKNFLKNDKNQITFKDEDMINFEEHTGYEAEILQNNIFGVDLDEQAAEIASVNLVLKALRRKEMLPLILGHTVMVGNSLISGSEEELSKYFGDDWQSVRPFNWEEEFARIMEEGGFDVVVGNPPYISSETMNKAERSYFMSSQRHETTYGKFDIFILFLELAIKSTKNGSRFGFIVPYPFLNQNYAKKIRKLMLDTCCIEKIVDFSQYKVFEDATVATCIVVAKKEIDKEIRDMNKVCVISQKDYSSGIKPNKENMKYITQNLFDKIPENMLRLEIDDGIFRMLEKVNGQSIRMGDLCYVITGAVIHDGKTGRSKEALIHDKKTNNDYKPYVEGKEVGRYSYVNGNRYLSYEPKVMHRPKFPELFENEKIFVRDIVGDMGLLATYDNRNYYSDHSLCCCVQKFNLIDAKRKDVRMSEEEASLSRNYNIKYLLGVMNSGLLNFYFKSIYGDALHVYPADIRDLPIRSIDIKNEFDKKAHEAIVALVDRMLSLNKQLNAVNTDFSHYLNLHPRVKDVKLEHYLEQIPEKDKEVLKDGSGNPANKLEGKVKKFEVRENGDWLIFKVGYSKKTQKETEIIIEFDAFKCRIPDTNLRKFIYCSVKEFITPGKVGKGNIYNRIQRTKLPCFSPKEEENKRVIDKIMDPYLSEVTKKEEIEKKIAETDQTIDQKVYELYGLTEEEIKIVEGSGDK